MQGVQSQIAAIQTGLEHNGRSALRSSPLGQTGGCMLLSDVTKGFYVFVLWLHIMGRPGNRDMGKKQSWDL